MADPFDRDILFCRMIGLLTQAELDSLAHKTIAVGGAGGVGFTHAECLVRQGIGHIKIADFDTFGPENMGRQFGCTVNTVGRDKSEVLEERLKSINPALTVERFGALSADNIERWVDGVDFIVDSIDYFQIIARRLVYQAARRRGVPVILAAPVAYGCTLHQFEPDHMAFDDYFDMHEGMSELEQIRNWGLGLGPMHLYKDYLPEPYLDLENRKTSITSSVCLMSTAILAATVLRRLLNQPVMIKPVPYVYAVDVVMLRFEELYLPEGVRGIRADPARYYRPSPRPLPGVAPATR